MWRWNKRNGICSRSKRYFNILRHKVSILDNSKLTSKKRENPGFNKTFSRFFLERLISNIQNLKQKKNVTEKDKENEFDNFLQDHSGDVLKFYNHLKIYISNRKLWTLILRRRKDKMLAKKKKIIQILSLLKRERTTPTNIYQKL